MSTRIAAVHFAVALALAAGSGRLAAQAAGHAGHHAPEPAAGAAARPVGAGQPSAAKAVVERFYAEAWNRKNLSVLDEIIATPSYRDNLKKSISSVHEGFPGISFRLEHLLGEGDRVVAHWRACGRNNGKLFGMPATGRRVDFSGIEISRVVDGKIVEQWEVWDRDGLMSQLKSTDAEGQSEECPGPAAATN